MEKETAKAQCKDSIARGETVGLLEQHAPDTFRATVGNISPGGTVVVEIEYIMELKHDAEVDGLRFTIPASITPAYHEAPGQPVPGFTETGGIKISIRVSMPSNIRAIQSPPPHLISVHLGAHDEDAEDTSFNPTLALVLFSQTSTEFGCDFIICIKCADLTSPRALLETHPPLRNSMALMVTLVPKFKLPSAPMPEIVFVVDRSASLTNKIVSLQSVLVLFLKALPFGVRFNICSFRSKHSFLWSKSQINSVDTLENAMEHVAGMKADFASINILPSIESIIARRFKDLKLEIFVLTSGEVWDSQRLFQYISEATAQGDVRLFSLGVGHNVRHSIVEGMARMGKGFSQIISDEEQKMEGKITRMLRAGLSAHVTDYRLEWDGKPTEEQRKMTAGGQFASPNLGSAKKINLFDLTADLDPPINLTNPDTADFPHLPEFTIPCALRAPYRLPPLFPFSRSTAYVVISGNVPAPSVIRLYGTSSSGELEVEIAVEALPKKGQTLHQLAARKILQELEEGTSYIHNNDFGVHQEKNASDLYVGQEGTRVGVTYGLASKWTSFVAIEKHQEIERPKDADLDSIPCTTVVTGNLVDARDKVVPSVSMFKDSQNLVFNYSTINFINHGDQHNISTPFDNSTDGLRCRPRPRPRFSRSRSPGLRLISTVPNGVVPLCLDRRISYTPVFNPGGAKIVLPHYTLTTDGSLLFDHEDDDGFVLAGTLADLVDRLIKDFQDLPMEPVSAMITKLYRQDIRMGEIYRYIFLTTYPAFTTAGNLLEILIQKLRDANTSANDHRAKCVILVMKYWLAIPRVRIDDHVLSQLREFALSIEVSGYGMDLASDVANLQDVQVLPPSSPMTPVEEDSIYAPMNMGVSAIATAFTVLEGRIYNRITPADYILHLLQPSTPNPNIDAARITESQINYWVKHHILKCHKFKERASVFEKCVHIAAKCHRLGNFASMAAIIEALQSPLIRRLTLTMREVGYSVLRLLSELSECMPKNWSTQFFFSTKDPLLPRIDIILAELNLVFRTYPATRELEGRPLINFLRSVQLARRLSKLVEYKLPEWPPSLPLQYFEAELRTFNINPLTDSDFGRRSHELELQENKDRDRDVGLKFRSGIKSVAGSLKLRLPLIN